MPIPRSMLIRESHIKRLAHEHQRRVSPGFIAALNEHVHYVLNKSCNQHNGGRVTLDRELLTLLFPTRP